MGRHSRGTAWALVTLIAVVVAGAAGGPAAAGARGMDVPPAQAVPGVTLPPGFAISVFADSVQDARFLTYSPQGDLYVGQLIGSRSAITILPDRNHDGQADSAIRVATDLNSPNNVAFRPAGVGTVFAAGAFDQVKVYTDTRGDLSYAASAVLVAGLSNVTTGRHKTKTVGYGPDGRFYLSKGSFADDPPSADPNAGIWRYNADGSGAHLFASGLRNTVGFAWDPVTGNFWGDDNGSDDLGRDTPHDELNLLVDGGDYGWPYCIDNGVHNDKTDPHDCSGTRAPAVLLPAHAGALQMLFYTGGSFPAHYWGGVFVVCHSVQYPEQRGVYYIPFAAGRPAGPPELFLADPSHRMLGLAQNPYDGSLLISDDREGRIYQVGYTGPPPAGTPAAPPPPAAAGRPAPVPAPPLPGVARVFPATGHSLNGAFLQFWFWNGGSDRFGAPVSDPLTEPGGDGQSYLVQYTERGRLEYHPAARGTAGEVVASTARYQDRYGVPPAGPTASPTAPAPAPATATTPRAATVTPLPAAPTTVPAPTPAPSSPASPVPPATTPPVSAAPPPPAPSDNTGWLALLALVAAGGLGAGVFAWRRRAGS